MTGITRHPALRTVFFLGLFTCLVATQFSYQSNAPKRGDIPLSSLSAPMVRATDLGLHSALASLLWLNIVQNVIYYAGHSSNNSMAGDIDTVTRLDPHFAYPYGFAVLMVPGLNRSQTKDAVEIGKRGVDLKLADWRIPYYLGFTYFYYLKDQPNAITYMRIAAETPGVPEGVKVTALNFGLAKSMRDQTRAFWQSIRDSARDDVVRQNAQDNLDHMDIVAGLQTLIETYKKAHGAYPLTLDALVTSGMISAIPVDPFGITFATDGQGSLTYSLER